ncbi:MAG TPA: TonB-dependent receptor [Azospirillaceae bacterium]|nr:TonB-dependent receptor [Azospirillaceae bacterium]
MSKGISSRLRAYAQALHLGTAAVGLTVGLTVAAGFAVPAAAQTTSSAIVGTVTLPDGSPATGAQVEVTHDFSGSRSTATVNADGRFQAQGLRAGGPYTVKISGVPGVPAQSVPDVFIRLGEPYRLEVALEQPADTIQEVVVTGDKLVTTALATGPSLAISRETLENTPTISRDIKDALKLDPRITVDLARSGLLQVAGTNGRFNSINVDGVRIGDDFGLNLNGYPTQQPPLSLDWIDQVSALIAPYDVTYSGFQGATINAVTKSGTNDFHGSAYYYYTDQDLSGEKSGNRTINQVFEEKTYGATLSGPIIQDKLFFFGGYEEFKASQPTLFGPLGSGRPNEIARVRQADLDRIIDISKRVYSFDPLTAPASTPSGSKKGIAKVDWNINDEHRLAVNYQRTTGSQLINQNDNPATGQVGTFASWYSRAIEMDSYAGQFFSDWTDSFSTEVQYSHKKVKTDQIPQGGRNFMAATVRIPSTNGQVLVGPDQFRQANALSNEADRYRVKGTYLLGDHTLTGGWDRDSLKVFNLFVPGAFGVFTFASIEDFENRRALSGSYTNALSGDPNDAAAKWGYDLDALYLQDQWNVTSDLLVTGGLRYERYSMDNDPVLNQTFVNRFGFANNESLDGRDIWLPRLGVTYTPTTSTTLRGGAGLFTGGSPNVWVSNSYSNTGVATASAVLSRNAQGVDPTGILDNVRGNAIPAPLQALLRAGDGNVNAIDPNFDLPSSWKYSIGVDQVLDLGTLGDDYVLTADILYTQVKDSIDWRELDIRQVRTAPDGRPIYGPVGTFTPGGHSDLLLVNQTEGHGLVLSLGLSKQWETDYGTFQGQVGYAYQDVTDVNPGNEFIAQRGFQWHAASNPNDKEVATSDYETKHRGTWSAGWADTLIGNLATKLSLSGDHRSGHPFSYTFDNRLNVADNTWGEVSVADAATARQLFYVPAGPGDIAALNGITFDQLNSFLQRTGLDQYAGRIAPRNAFRSNPVNIVSLHAEQELPSVFEGHRAVFTIDIFNLGNLLNKNWGRYSQVNDPVRPPLVSTGIAATIDPATGKYVYTYRGPRDGAGNPVLPQKFVSPRLSVWNIQVGVRYEF